MLKITAIFRSESVYFVNKISENARRVIYSDISHTLASPLADIFLGAFIWRSTGSLLSVLLYKVGKWIFLPLVFYANGRLLRIFPVQRTFAFGAILAGLCPLALISLAGSGNGAIFACACLHGIGDGFYYANRNYLEFKETVSEARKYFFSLLSAASGISGIIVPLLAGWFICFGETSSLYTAIQAYWALFVLALVFMLGCAAFIWNGNFTSLPLDSLKVNAIRVWTKRRLLFFSHGFFDGAGFITSPLLLYALGNEGKLGTAASITALCLIIATYLYGRFAPSRFERHALLISALLFLIASAGLLLLPPIPGVLAYSLIIAIAFRFNMVSSSSIGLALADEEARERPNTSYAFIIDNELVLNLGRLAGAVLVACLALYFSQKTGLFYGPLVLAFMHITLVVIFLRKK